MKNFDYTLSLNGEQVPVTIQQYEEGERTYYDIVFEDHTISIYKDTLYTWTSDNPQEFSKADIQSIGEQIDNPQS
jgi:hypothetical protein